MMLMTHFKDNLEVIVVRKHFITSLFKGTLRTVYSYKYSRSNLFPILSHLFGHVTYGECNIQPLNIKDAKCEGKF